MNETVRVAKRFLEEHPEEMRKVRQVFQTHGYEKTYSKESQEIAEFLGWNIPRVRTTLERLGLIDEGIVEPEAVRSLPTERTTREEMRDGG